MDQGRPQQEVVVELLGGPPRAAVADLPPLVRKVSRTTAWRWRRDRGLTRAECPAGEWVLLRIGLALRWVPLPFVRGLMREQLGLFG